jgi:DNA polymerase-3 subunit epsilon
MAWFRSPGWRETVFWALDLEASGLDPRSASVLSVGMVPIRDGVVRWGQRWYSLAQPATSERAATDAVRVHEILPDELTGSPPMADLVPEIERRIREGVLLVHWRHLDVPLLRRCFREAGVPWPRPRVVDTTDLLARLDRRRRLLEPEPRPTPTQLAAARRALDLPAHTEHHALYDALATAELFLLLRARLRLDRVGQLT